MSDIAQHPRPQGRLLVGLGASAGGLEVLQRFLSLMPSDSGMSFLVIQHLAPTTPSLLTEILARSTGMRVVEASHGAPLLTRYEGERGHSLPIDACFASMAEHHGTRAVGVILSGTGADGTAGCRAILDHGGRTLVQWPEEATYSGMPDSAIQAGNASHVMSVEQM
ncbi:hypothetical protein AO263_34260, partial [Pseudomonas sp. NZIPFR-PS5]